MRIEFFFEAGLSLLAVFASLWYVSRLNVRLGRPAWDAFTVLIGAAAVAVVLVIILSG